MAIDTVQFCYSDGVSSPAEVCQTAQSLTFEDGSSPELLTNLAAWWSLEEASGSRLNSHEQSSPADHPMAEGVSMGNRTGKINNAADFSSSYLYLDETGNSPMPSIMTADKLSVCLWVKFDTIIDPPSISGLQHLFQRGDLTTLQSGEFTIYLNHNPSVSPNQMEFMVLTFGPGRNRATHSGFVPAIDTWYFVYAYYDNTSAGKPQGISVNAGTISEHAVDSNPVPGSEGVIQLGQFKDNASFYRRLDGGLDEVAVWTDRILTTDEVTWLYNSGNGRSYSDL